MDDDGLARAHPLDDVPLRLERQERLVVGVGGPHDRHREVALAVGGDEELLAGDLVARVLPLRVLQRRRLDDGHVGRRRLVGRGRGDEDVLVAPAGEDVDVALHLRGNEVDPVDDGVVVLPADRLAQRVGVVRVGGEPGDVLGEAAEVGRAAVEDGDVDALAHRLADARGADDAAAADEQDLQMRHVRSFARCFRADPSASLPVSGRAPGGPIRRGVSAARASRGPGTGRRGRRRVRRRPPARWRAASAPRRRASSRGWRA